MKSPASIVISLPCLLVLILIVGIVNTTAQEREDPEQEPEFTGPFEKIFDIADNLFIYPTGLQDSGMQQQLLYLAQSLKEACKDAELISDSLALGRDVTHRNVFVLGNSETNVWLKRHQDLFLFSVRDSFIIADTVYFGNQLLLAHCQPNPYDFTKGWFLLYGMEDKSYEILYTNHFYGILKKDWSVLDSTGFLASYDFINKEESWAYDKSVHLDRRKDAKWIWYPGDFSIELNRKTSILRKERNQIYPPLWRVDAPFGRVHFNKSFFLKQADTISVFADGDFSIMDNSLRLHDFNPENLILQPGRHNLMIDVVNFNGLPALYMQGRNVITDNSWDVSLGWNHEKIRPESGQFNDPQYPPGDYRLLETEIRPVSVTKSDSSIMADFGQETFGRLILEDVVGEGKLLIIYGESVEEAKAGKRAETWEIVEVNHSHPLNDTLSVPMAFRYVNVIPSESASIENISHLYEYLPLEQVGSFNSSDSILNEIFLTSSRTLILNTREVLFDGIKRDRWCWSGDVFLGLFLDYYHYFDEDVIRRSLVALRGHDPIMHHINTIPSYTFYWFINIYNHYVYTADSLFIEEMYDGMKSMMDFCLNSRNEEGFFVYNMSRDWPFVDWTETPFKPVMCYEQILLLKSIEILADFAELTGNQEDVNKYMSMANELREKIWDRYWIEDLQGFIHYEGDSEDPTVTRYSNIYASLFGYLTDKQMLVMKDSILLNDSIPQVTIPLHKTFEQAVLCEAGEHEIAMEKMRQYWKGMLDMGATTFWEYYDEEKEGGEHYVHSGREFGKSLCHIWSAGPIYILGKYIAGIRPLEPGYKSYLVEPHLGGLKWFNTSVPVKGGMVEIAMNESEISIRSDICGGLCRFNSQKKPKLNIGKVQRIGENLYEVHLEQNQQHIIRYY